MRSSRTISSRLTLFNLPQSHSIRQAPKVKGISQLFSTKKEIEPAMLSEKFSRIKKTLIKDFSIENIDKAAHQLEQLIEQFPKIKPGMFLSILLAKTHYLYASCLLYSESHREKPNFDLSRSKMACQSLSIATKLGLDDLNKASRLAANFYIKALEIEKAVDAHNNRDDSPPRSPRGNKVEYPLRKVVGEESFIESFADNFNLIMASLEGPLKENINSLLKSALNLESEHASGRYDSPRQSSTLAI